MVNNRESTLETLGLAEPAPPAVPGSTPPPPAPPQAPPPPPAAKPAWTRPKPAEPAKEAEKPAEAAKPAPPLLAGKYASPKDLSNGIRELSRKLGKESEVFTDVKEAEEYYKNLEREFHSTPPAERKTTPPPAETKPPEVQEEEIPDAILDPDAFKKYVRNLPTRAAQMAAQMVTAERELDKIRADWRENNSDILQLQPEIERAIANDARCLQLRPGDREGLLSIIQEHTNRFRELARGFMDIGRQEEATKYAGVPPSAPQYSTNGQQPPSPPEETPAETGDEVDDYIRSREKSVSQRRGYGYGRDDMSRSMNQR